MYIVEIKTPNQIFVHRGKPVRSPVKFFDVLESELEILKGQARKTHSILSVCLKEEVEPKKFEYIEEEKEYIVDDLDDKSENDKQQNLSILDKLLKGERIE